MRTLTPPARRLAHRPARLALAAPLGLAAVFFLAGCASIMHGTTQQVSVASSPTGAQLSVNGMTMGTTPVILASRMP